MPRKDPALETSDQYLIKKLQEEIALLECNLAQKSELLYLLKKISNGKESCPQCMVVSELIDEALKI